MSKQVTIPLDLPDVKVVGVEERASGEYVIRVESTQAWARCHRCGQISTESHGRDEPITLRHLPILGRNVYIQLRPKRFRCPYCADKPTSTQRLEWYDPRSPHTKAYEQHLLIQLIQSTIQDVSRKEDIGYAAIEGVLDRHVASVVDWRVYERLDVLGIDEIALKKGHQDYLVIVTARFSAERIVVLGVLPDRKRATLTAFFRTIPDRLKRTIHTVCTDMYENYVSAAKEVLPQANVVVDRFHVAKSYRQCVDNLRKQELARLKKELPAEEYQPLKRTLWLFRKNQADLTPEQAERLQPLLTHSPALKQAYDLREALTAIFESHLTKQQALDALDDWHVDACNSHLDCFDPFFTTLGHYLDQIANYFLDRASSGFVEGFNTKLKVLKRRCYGILNHAHLFQRLVLDFDGYRLFARRTRPLFGTPH
jgi:transposase